MCGIFGFIVNEHANLTPPTLRSIINHLFILSASRGKEASGIAVFSGTKTSVCKEGMIASRFIRSRRYRQFFEDLFCNVIKMSLAAMGHTRLATNGPQSDNENNSPLVCGDVIGVHNGIIVNDGEIWKTFPSLQRRSFVDSESLFAMLNLYAASGLSLAEATKGAFNKIEGSASIACIVSKNDNMILATNTGSLYSSRNAKGDMRIFASEFYILEKVISRIGLDSGLGRWEVSQIKAGQGCLINIRDLTAQEFSLN